MTTPALNGQRLQALRELEGLTQGALAERLGTSQPAISQIEKAERPLRPELATRAQGEFGVPESFFTVPPSLLDISFPTFRKSSAAKLADERRIVRQYREASRVFETASRSSGYHEALLPDLSQLEPEDAATKVRSLGGTSVDGPITNMTRLLERLGIGVITHLDNEGTAEPKHAGISIPTVGISRPLIALTAPLPGAVMRFTLAHELAHHIWDRSTAQAWTSTRAPQERRAHAFAGALLLPAAMIKERVSEALNLEAYLRIKADYGVSVGAIIIRAQHLGVVSPDRARSLHIQLSSRGWRRDEPVEVAPERPLLLKQSLERVTGLSVSRVEQLSGLPAAMVFHWIGHEVPAVSDGVVDFSEWRKNRVRQ